MSFLGTGCKKEYITNLTQIDSMAIAKGLILGHWISNHSEAQIYSGGTATSTVIVAGGSNSYLNMNADSTYINFYNGTLNGSGTWQLLSSSYLVFDKGTGQERYYFIIKLDKNVFITHGPFKANGTLYTTELDTNYLDK